MLVIQTVLLLGFTPYNRNQNTAMEPFVENPARVLEGERS